METLENLKRKISSAGELESVVKTMKALAASNIGQYEMATQALSDYYKTIELGMLAFLKQEESKTILVEYQDYKINSILALVFGSDQGLVGAFNQSLSDFVTITLKDFEQKKTVWCVGERIQERLNDSGFRITKSFSIPNSVTAITSLISQLLNEIEIDREKNDTKEIYTALAYLKNENELVTIFNKPIETITKDMVFFVIANEAGL